MPYLWSYSGDIIIVVIISLLAVLCSVRSLCLLVVRSCGSDGVGLV